MILATWNLEHFWHKQNEPLLIRKNGERSRLRDERLIKRTKDAVTSLNADILCLQEIGGTSGLEYLCPNRQHYTEYRLNAELPANKRKHGVGFAIAPNLLVRQLPDLKLSEVSGADDYARDAVVLCVEDRFLVVGLHLKSGCRDKLRLDKRAPCKILDLQVTLLCEWMQIQSLPIILMGDFNRVLSQARDTVLAKLKLAADVDIAPVMRREIDHILAPKDWSLLPTRPLGLNGYSDHKPVVMMLNSS
ncbi:MAG: endonuclease/exonuclease/phosphatase family protein [Alphaproteobacteria bacterium]